jgi:hypothetical protein
MIKIFEFEIDKEKFYSMVRNAVSIRLHFKDVNNEEYLFDVIDVLSYPPIGSTIELSYYDDDRYRYNKSLFKVKDIKIDYTSVNTDGDYLTCVYVGETK